MKLESSVSSRGGSLLNQIVELAHPEERMAARLVERLNASPPIDVEAICRGLAELKFKTFPISIDGLCLDLKLPGKRPKVWLSEDMPPVRQRFTLAHEIGHIVIPWHTGSILDNIDAPRSAERGRYRTMEVEANRFAAELLMPSAWVTGIAERSEHVSDLMHTIRHVADVSLPAAFLKASKLGRPGFVGAEIRNGIVARSVRTPGTHSIPPAHSSLLADVGMPAAYEPRVLSGQDASYYWWQIREHIPDPGSDLPEWRTILNDMLLEIPPAFRPKTRASVNAIVGLAIGRVPKGSPVGKVFKHGLEAAQNRRDESQWVKHVISHPCFSDYVLARARDRASS